MVYEQDSGAMLSMDTAGTTDHDVINWYPIESHMVRPVYFNGIDSQGWNGLHAFTRPIERNIVVILNGEQEHSVSALREMWIDAVLKVAVDGGANFVYNQIGHKQEDLIPDVITGDFDSIGDDVLNYYKDKELYKPIIHHTPDQNETDFMKCIRFVSHIIEEKHVEADRILVFGAYGGRLDHVFANVNVLLVAQSLSVPHIILLSERQQTFLLKKGKHVIHIRDIDIIEWCGLVPVSGSVILATTGLKWNLSNQTLEYGNLISTSNKVLSSTVHIECDNNLVWMMGFTPL